jgi:phospho-2-dehydro-3-deoxyheptonate aldolase
VSITDGCVAWEESRALLDELAEAVRKRRVKAEAEAE